MIRSKPYIIIGIQDYVHLRVQLGSLSTALGAGSMYTYLGIYGGCTRGNYVTAVRQL